MQSCAHLQNFTSVREDLLDCFMTLLVLASHSILSPETYLALCSVAMESRSDASELRPVVVQPQKTTHKELQFDTRYGWT
jgi:hypothetical protein